MVNYILWFFGNFIIFVVFFRIWCYFCLNFFDWVELYIWMVVIMYFVKRDLYVLKDYKWFIKDNVNIMLFCV